MNRKFGIWEMKKIWNLGNEPIARNPTDCVLFNISKIVIGPKCNSQATNYNACLFHGTIKNGIKRWHILSNIHNFAEQKDAAVRGAPHQ